MCIRDSLLNKAAKPEQVSEELGLRFIETLVINPSEPIDEIAIKHIQRLPAPIRQFFGLNKEPVEGGVSLASYLLFEGEFLRELVSLGYRDAQKQAKEIEEFFNHENA